MKKVFKIIGIIFGVLFAIGMIGVVLETPEQRAERETQMAQDKAEAEAKKARLEPEEKAKQTEAEAKKQAELEAKAKQEDKEKAKTEAEEKAKAEAPANLGMTAQELGSKIDKILKGTTNLGAIKASGSTYLQEVDEIIWSGNIDKTGNISSSEFRAKITPEDSQDKSMALLLLAGANVRAIHPNATKEESTAKMAKMVNDATAKALQTKQDVDDSFLIGDIKHYVTIYPETAVIAIGAYHKDH